MDIGIFAEDAAHEAFVAPLAVRLAVDEGVEPHIHVRSSSGGIGVALRELKQYIRDLSLGYDDFLEVLIVAIDSNCQGPAVRRKQVEAIVGGKYAGRLVLAVPDPHIERWYLADPLVVGRLFGEERGADVPAQKCERNRYKKVLREAFLPFGVDPPTGGSEYGADIVSEMDLDRALEVESLRAFADDLTGEIRSLRA